MLNFTLQIKEDFVGTWPPPAASLKPDNYEIIDSPEFRLYLEKKANEDDHFENEDFLCIIHGYCLYGQDSLSAEKFIQEFAVHSFSNSYLSNLRGAFIILILNKTESQFKIYSDPLTIRTLYYGNIQKTVVVSTKKTELLKLLKDVGIQLKINKLAIVDILLFDFILDQQTIFEDLHELDGGTLLTIKKGKISKTQIVDAQRELSPEQSRIEGIQAIDRVRSTMKTLVNSYVESSEDMSIALTGGFDSRSILSLLNGNVTNYQFFSYGLKGSKDIEIPEKIADTLNLHYTPIYLEEEFRKSFEYHATEAVLQGDGECRFSQANIAYVYSNFFRDKRFLLTGLFGSELIKMPTSRGMFLDTNAIELLRSTSIDRFIRQKLTDLGVNGFKNLVDPQLIDIYTDRLNQNHLIANDSEYPIKLFHFLVQIGIRKYFRKEIKLTDNWITNKFPFFDYEFLKTLLTTSFPWVHNFSDKKNLRKNVRIYQLYGSLINENKALAGVTSTHGFRPKLLQHPFYFPLLAWEYTKHKKQKTAKSSMNFLRPLSLNYMNKNRERLIHGNEDLNYFFDSQDFSMKTKINLFSLQFWLTEHGYSIG